MEAQRSPQAAIASLLSALKSCSRSKDLDSGKHLHNLAVERGLFSNVFVATTVVDMYAKCGKMVEARKAFDEMLVWDAVPWNALILGYLENGEMDLALETFAEMQQQHQSFRGCKPNAKTFTAALMACTKLASKEDGRQIDGKTVKVHCLETGKTIHRQAAKAGCDSHLFLASTLVDMYAKCGSMEDSRKVFERIPGHNVVSWTSLILGYAENGEAQLALEIFSRMRYVGCEADARAFVAVLTACAALAENEIGKEVNGMVVKLKSLEIGMDLHSQAVRNDCGENVFVASTVVDMYAKSGSLVDARNAFDRMPMQDIVSWTAMILGYVENGESLLGLELFSCMEATGGFANARVFTAALMACASLAEAEDGKQVHGRPVKLKFLENGLEIHSRAANCGHDKEIYVANTLVDVYAKCRSLVDARRVFDTMVSHDVVSWTALILGYAENGEGFLALEVFGRMTCDPDSRAFLAALAACGSVVALEAGKAIQAEIYRRGLEMEDSVGNSLMDFYGKCGSMEKAECVFDSAAATKDRVQWNSLITGYGFQGEAEKVFGLFGKMQGEGVQADGVTFLSVLAACSHSGLAGKARILFREMPSKYGVTPKLQHFTCMVDLLGRANHLEEAVELLRGMPFEADLVTWTTVLGACRKWRNVEIGRLAFDSLMKLDVRDGAAYVLMGNIYGSLGLWKEKEQILGERRASRAWKEAGQSWWIDGSGRVHKFMAGDLSNHPQAEEIAAKLKELVVRMKQAGYVADVGSVVREFGSDAEKEMSLCGHSERLAIGCALLNSEAGSVIRIGKNLRVCRDCHSATGIISKIERRTIVCRDANRFHTFVDGNCSCGDFW